jgi:pimeloyl-ACP methyl ester carboxylesterase
MVTPTHPWPFGVGPWTWRARATGGDGPPGASDVLLQTEDGLELDAWYLRAAGAEAPAVLVANGNGGSRELRAPLARALAARGLSVLLFDYRGYGGRRRARRRDPEPVTASTRSDLRSDAGPRVTRGRRPSTVGLRPHPPARVPSRAQARRLAPCGVHACRRPAR